MVASASAKSDPTPAIGSMPVAVKVEPDESGTDPRPTPFAHAVFPPSYEEDGPTSRDLLLDDRVERLLRENLELLKERAAMRSIHEQRIERSNELLAEARLAKKLVRAAIEESDEIVNKAECVTAPVDSPCLTALRAWAAKPL